MKTRLVFLLIITFVTTITYSQEKMEVDGAIIINHSEDPIPVAGTIRFNTTNNDFEGWNGLYWASLTGNQFEIGELIDQEGNTYPTVVIGTQEWMGTNLRTTTYRNGNPIALIGNDAAGDTAWSSANSGAYAVYDTIGTGYAFDLNRFGYLYNWFSVNDSRRLCPSGWHVPTDTEWTTLADHLGGQDIAGGLMKESGISNWDSPNTNATNESGFTALPGGSRELDGSYFVEGVSGNWWSSTVSTDSSFAWHRYLFYTVEFLGRFEQHKRSGYSVRCLRD